VTDQLAHEVFTGLIVGSDAVVDLHAGDLVEALTPFTLYEESAVDVAARGLAEAYGLPLAIRQPVGEREVGGSTSSAAADSGIPAIIAEAGGGGRLDPGSVALHVAGLRGIAGHLGLLPRSSPAPAGIGPRHFSRFVWVRCGVDGWWEPSLGVGREVAAGQELGHVLDLFGDERERIVSPVTGVIVFQTTSPAVGEQGLVCALAAGEEP
jgi:predicted deacylase